MGGIRAEEQLKLMDFLLFESEEQQEMGKQPRSAVELESIWSHCSSRLSGESHQTLASPFSPLQGLRAPFLFPEHTGMCWLGVLGIAGIY